jgi:hypothetical protein
MAGIVAYGPALQQPSGEDSVIAINMMIVASHGNGAVDPSLKAAYSCDFLPWMKNRAFPLSNWSASLLKILGTDPSSLKPKRNTQNPFLAEMFACALLPRLGIQVAPAKICTASEAKTLGPSFVVKALNRNPMLGLKWTGKGTILTNAHYCLVSQIVPDAATLSYVSRHFPDNRGSSFSFLENFGTSMHSFLQGCGEYYEEFGREIARVIGKECVAADGLYVNFKPTPEELQAIRRAAAWHGEQYLKLCAARVFLGCSTPHASNVLVTRDAQLISIDHATAHAENGEDLGMLFRFVRRDSLAFSVLGDVATLNESDIRAAVSEIPKHPACGSIDGLAEYFTRRLELWKALYSRRQENQQPSASGVKVPAAV